jgi:betaine-homocysteine S-methyltransferase
MAEALGRKPAASRYTEDMSKHYVLGSHKSFRKANTEYRTRLQGTKVEVD